MKVALDRLPAVLQWAALLLLSVFVFSLLQLVHMPAALLLASMLAAIACSTRSFTVRVPRQPFMFAQGLIGCLMAQSLQPQMLQRVLHDWPLFLGFTVLVMGTSAVLGWLLARHHVLPGTTAVWGLAPGAASAMVLMSESYGADARLVAFMQYTRVVIVTCIAALVARLWLGTPTSEAASGSLWALQHGPDVGWTVSLVLAGLLLSRWLGFSTGAMMLPLGLGVLFQGLGWLVIELPPALLAVAYMLIGWNIGLRYTPATLAHAWRALPRVLMSIAVLVALGMVLAVALAWLGGFDPLTAYLATSPGGADSVAIIATHAATVDAGFVMAMQLARFVLVFLFGPSVSRWVAQRTQT
jgi:membrane AbrB-like protein